MCRRDMPWVEKYIPKIKRSVGTHHIVGLSVSHSGQHNKMICFHAFLTATAEHIKLDGWPSDGVYIIRYQNVGTLHSIHLNLFEPSLNFDVRTSCNKTIQ